MQTVFMETDTPKGDALIKEIKRLKEEKNAIILAHFYQNPDIQDIADFIGDSLQLSQQAASTNADIIVFAGVHFMAETAKILSPQKKVLLPDLDAGCSLADSCPPDKFADFIALHPDHTVISYVNTTTSIKAMSDIICTSSNAVQIVQSLPPDTKIIFAPDKNLGDYISRQTNRNMVVWDGHCHVHQEFSLPRILALRQEYPDAKIIVHPECDKPVLMVADFIGSTAALLRYTITDAAHEYIVATESGILYQMRKANPTKIFIPAPPEDSTCACNDCMFMKMITLPKIYNTLFFEQPEITIEESVRVKAYKPIIRMLELSKQLGIN